MSVCRGDEERGTRWRRAGRGEIAGMWRSPKREERHAKVEVALTSVSRRNSFAASLLGLTSGWYFLARSRKAALSCARVAPGCTPSTE